MQGDSKRSDPSQKVAVETVLAGGNAIVVGKIETLNVGEGKKARDASGPKGVSSLMAGDYRSAVLSLREALSTNPHQTLLNVALGVALSNGLNLRSLDYQVAKEIHRQLLLGFGEESSRAISVVALTALKLDYFKKNSVRDEPPRLEELIPLLRSTRLNSKEKSILSMFKMSEATRSRVNL